MPTKAHQSDAEPEARKQPDTHDADVERLAREFGEVVEHVPEGEREALRDYAVELLREESESARQKETDRTADERKTPLGAFGFVVLLLVAGGALLFVLPPVGIVLLLLALPVAGWGLLQMVLGRTRAGPSSGE
jgi:hypothetical protein